MIRRAPTRRSAKRARDRRGTATIEFALVIPAILLLTVGTIDVCTALFLKESAVLAAYEGAREGIGRGDTNSEVRDRVEQFLNERNIEFDENVLTISEPGFDVAEALDEVTVTVSIPIQGNTLIPSQLLGGAAMTASVTMLKEYRNLD